MIKLIAISLLHPTVEKQKYQIQHSIK